VKLSTFIEVFVVALYNETLTSNKTHFQIGEILEKYNLTFNPAWRDTFFADYTFSNLVNVRRHLGPISEQRVALSPDGFRWVEDELSENVVAFLEQHGARIGVPASDRLVSLDHNSQEYYVVKDGLAELYETIRATNDLPIDGMERSRLLSSLKSAKALWEAGQLKVIQVKVGILMAVEDAQVTLAATTKATVAALIVDALKSLVKNITGIDLDNI